MVEFRYDPAQHKSFFMEVNGRYWGTLALPIHAGIDFPWYEWQIAHRKKPAVPLNYSVGVRWRWSAGYIRRWHGLVRNLASNASHHPEELKDLLPPYGDLRARDALWDSSDPVPAIVEPFRTMKKLAVSDIKQIMRAVRR